MRLQILSDLHIEGDDRFQIPNIKSDLIILAGDIHRGIKAAEWSIEQSNKLNKPIMQIAGNHEYYGLYYENVNRELEEITKNTKVMFLHNKSFIWPAWGKGKAIRFLGTTLWSNFRGLGDQYLNEAKNDAQRWISDYSKIMYMGHRITPDDTEKFYMEATAFLYKELAKPFIGKTVLITHHGPSPKCHNSQRHGLPNPLSTYFWSDLEDLIIPAKIDLVIYGHTHSNLRFEVNGVPVICNQKGYPNENKFEPNDFDINYTIEV